MCPFMCSCSLLISSSNDRHVMRLPKKCSIENDYDDDDCEICCSLISYIDNMQYSESWVSYESFNSFRITCLTIKYANTSHSSEQLWAQVNFVWGNCLELYILQRF